MKIKRRFEMTKEATFDFEFVCSVCNSQLKSFVWSGDIIFVYPCERCLKDCTEEILKQGGDVIKI